MKNVLETISVLITINFTMMSYLVVIIVINHKSKIKSVQKISQQFLAKSVETKRFHNIIINLSNCKIFIKKYTFLSVKKYLELSIKSFDET